MKIELSTARELALRCQGLDGRLGLPPGKEGVARTVERLGYVQIDTISVVERAHHHTLWARCPGYDPAMLHELQALDRRVFEWWASAMSYVPMSDYRYYWPRMQAAAQRPRTQEWLKENEELANLVLARIRAEGPLGTQDFEAPEGFQRGNWWSWKPAKRALETLFNCGELMVTQRRNFQRIFDLRERVLPSGVDTSTPTPEEVERFELRRVLGGLGLANADDIRWQRWGGPRASGEVIQELEDTGEVTRFEVEGLGDTTFCALTCMLQAVTEHPAQDESVHILSPFDNLVIRRGWLKALFGFDYKIEAYTPANKRQYGYFCLPVLWGTQFAGRMDAKADRKPQTLIVRALILEPDFQGDDRFWPSFADKLRSFAAFNGCERIVIERTDPEVAKAPLLRALDGPA